MRQKINISLIVLAGLMLTACPAPVTQTPAGSKAITSFIFVDYGATGTIDDAHRRITVTVPWDIDLASQQLTPTIAHSGTHISPASGSPQYFNNQLTYRVTAEDGSTQDYIVTVTAAQPGNVTVTYVGNNNTGGSAPADTNYFQGDTVTVMANTGNLIRIPAAGTAEAFKFGGWNTKADGSGTTYAAGTGTFTITKDTTLYAKWVNFELRDTGPAGGFIYYDKGSFSNGWRYLEAAPSDQTTGVEWGYSNLSGYTLAAVGEGKTNTNEIINQITISGYFKNAYAAKICKDLSITSNGVGYSDWFLPSIDELKLMCNNLYPFGVGGLTVAGDITSDACYWSSSENITIPYQYSQVMVITTQWGPGQYARLNITRYCRVRACREF